MPSLTYIDKLDERREFLVVHPLDDLPEQKVDTANLGLGIAGVFGRG